MPYGYSKCYVSQKNKSSRIIYTASGKFFGRYEWIRALKSASFFENLMMSSIQRHYFPDVISNQTVVVNKKKIRKPLPIQRMAREWALQLLYQLDIRDEELCESTIEDFQIQILELNSHVGHKEETKIKEIYLRLVKGVLGQLETIDNAITERAENWSFERIAAVDRNIMRIAVYEMLFVPDIPDIVSINEAIEIAKSFGSDDSGKFVNGILDKVNNKGK